MQSDVRAIAFDLDNTLWDVEPVLARAEERLFAWLERHCPRIARHVTREDMRRARERLAHQEPHNAHDVTYLRLTALATHAREHGYDECVANDAFAVFLAARNEVELFADVTPGLARLHRRYALASLSNGNADLARIGLDPLFAVSLNARQIGAAKPERRCFERLAQGLALAPGEIAYVGDDPLLDVAAARAAGLHTVWMNRRALAWPAELAPADLVVGDCLQLAAALGC
ncbi:MAG TPA: HAD-IA family hydrolase [Steroidobacteraceae bacterium]|nr:HAD-IA family hydrolase [Steroidobacteraceae bacterium]